MIRSLIIFSTHTIARLLLASHVILARYEHAFGHQAWNLEYIARLYFRLHGRRPRIIAFQRSRYIPNHALYQHHRQSGIRVLRNNHPLTRLFRAARTDLKNRATTGSSGQGSDNPFLYCRFSMDQLHTDLLTEQEEVAYPFKKHNTFCSSGQQPELNLGAFFCFQDRTTKYKSEISKDMPPDFVYDNQFDRARNTELKDLYPAIDALAGEGLTAVRLGVSPKHPAGNENVFDYASDGLRSNGHNDLVLMSGCKFFVGPNSGIWLLARSQNKPTCLVNVFPWPWINLPLRNDCLVMPKKLWLRAERRFMTVKEMVQMEKRFKWKFFYQDDSFHSLNIEVIDNTAEELRHALIEMNQRLDGIWNGNSFKVTEVLSDGNVGRKSEAVFPSFFVLQNPDLFPASFRERTL